jgi:hypothetical protein
VQDLHVAREAAQERRCHSTSSFIIHIDLFATLQQSFYALIMSHLTGEMNRPSRFRTIICL